jgi:hypothetical protein
MTSGSSLFMSQLGKVLPKRTLSTLQLAFSVFLERCQTTAAGSSSNA